MDRHPRVTRRAASLGLAGIFLAGSAVSARQGHSPFGDATPEATPVSGASPVAEGWRISDATALDLDGIPCALSPDGQWLAGIGPDREFSLWNTADLAQVLVPFHEAIDPDSIVWSPDSTAVAFSLQAFMYGIDGDIFVYELADDTIHNLTDDGVEGGFITDNDDKPFPIDVMPAWTPDGEAIVFARSVWADADSIPTEIARIARAGGDLEILKTVEARPFSIYTPMEVLADGSILYAFSFSDMDDEENGVWRLDPDGTATLLIPGTRADTVPTPVMLDVWDDGDELKIAVLSVALMNLTDPEQPWLMAWSSTTGEVEPFAGTGESESAIEWLLSAFWSPDGGTVFVVESLGDGQIAIVSTGSTRDVTILPELMGSTSRGPRWIRPTWSAANTVLLSGVAGGAYLLTVEPLGIAG